MKTKAIVALLLMAAASADARFAWPYPPKAAPPTEIGHWVVINGNALSDSAVSELTTASLSGGGPDVQNHRQPVIQCAALKACSTPFTLCEMAIFKCLR